MFELQTFTKILEQNGYAMEDYQVDLMIYSQFNQVIIITDIPNQRTVRIPVEDNVLDWGYDRLAEEVVDAIDKANARKEHDDFRNY